MDFCMKHASVIGYRGNCCLGTKVSSRGCRNAETFQHQTQVLSTLV